MEIMDHIVMLIPIMLVILMGIVALHKIKQEDEEEAKANEKT